MTEKATKENLKRLKKALEDKKVSKLAKNLIESKIELIEKQKTVNK